MAVMAGLGALRFEVSDLNFQSLERGFEYRWVAQERLGRRPAQQFMGPGEETVKLDGTIYPGHPLFEGALNQLNELRSKAMSGQPYRFGANVGGVGRNYGRWCIRRVTDNQTYFNPNGTPRKVEFTIELVEYGADGGAIARFF